MLEAEEQCSGVFEILRRKDQSYEENGTARSSQWMFCSAPDWSAAGGSLVERKGSFAPDVIARGSDRWLILHLVWCSLTVSEP